MSVMGGIGGAFLPPVVMSIIADATGVKAGVGEATKEMSKLEAASKQLAGVGKVAMAGFAIGGAVAAAESVKLAASFDQTMELIHTQAMASQPAVDALSGSVLKLAGQVGQGPDSLAEALYHIASVLGPQVMDTAQGQAQAMDILTQSAKLASLGMANLDDVTYAMSGVMSVGMKDVHNATDAIALMNATVGMGDMRMQDLSAAIGTGVLPAFKTAGLGMTDFSAALATLTDNSVPANEAATRLRMTIALLTAPSGEAEKALEDIGLSQLDAANALTARDAELSQFGISVSQLAADMQQPNGLLVAVKDLKSHLEGLSAPAAAAVIEKAFGGGKTSGAIQTLLAETDKLQSKYDAMGDSAQRAATFNQAWADQQKQFAQQWHDLTAKVEAFGVTVGNKLIPKIQDAITWMSQHKELIKVLAFVIGTVLVIAIAAYAVAMAQAAIATIAATWPVLAVIAVLALLVWGIFELHKHWTYIWNHIKEIGSAIGNWFAGPFADFFVGVWHAIYDNFLGPVGHFFHVVWDGITDFFRKWWPLLLAIFMPAVFAIMALWHRFHKDIEDLAKAVWERVKSAFDLWWRGIQDIAKVAWGLIRDYIVHPIEDAWHAITDVAEKIWHAISGAFDSAWQAVKDVGDKFLSIGENIVMGVVHGIEGAAHKLWDKVGDLANGALKKAKDMLGISSPSKVFAEQVGQWIPSGVAQGVTQHVGVAQAAVTSMADGVSAPPGSPRPVISVPVRAPAPSAGGGDQVIHWHLNLDSREIRSGQLRLARDKSIAPSQLLPATVGAL